MCEDLAAAPCSLPVIPRAPQLDGRLPLDAERSRVPAVGLALARWVMLRWEVGRDRFWVPKVLWNFPLVVGAAGCPLFPISALLSLLWAVPVQRTEWL